jgi:F0F1-type ATP synthase assembly protein I
MTAHQTGLIAVVVLLSVVIGAAIVLAGQDPTLVSVPGVLGGLGAVLVGLLGLNAWNRRHGKDGDE